jgi:acyl-CoA dehydrogenase
MPNFEFSDEEKQLMETAREFSLREIVPVAGELDEHGTFPTDICNKAWETGLMNCELPEAYGGLGLGCLAHCLVLEEISYGCTGVNTTLAANMLGTMPIIIAGTEAQKKEYFGRLLAKPIFAAYCCSEPDAGSDVAGMKTRYRKQGDEYVITGQKRWITNGGVASFYTVFAREEGSTRHKGITCFIVERDTPGVSVGKKENKMGQRCSNTTDVIFEDVKVGKANIVGPEGEGFKVAMRSFDRTRPWIAAGAAGIIRRSLDECRKYALERKTFGVPIAQHQAIQFRIAQIATELAAARILMHGAAIQEHTSQAGRLAAQAKLYASEAANRACAESLQIHGGNGFHEDYEIARLYRDVRVTTIYEGTSEMQRLVIARHLLQK